ncbi:MAG: nitronate monooxygenase [Bacteroidota bacterium]|nr:nitronate monooxygenase [Bacteroidota bacterium]
MKSFKIGNLEVKLPIIQGGMGVAISLSGLASAVANQGGIGVISAVGIGMTEPGYRKNFRESNKIALRKEIRKAKKLTDGILGVNIMMAVTDYEDLFKVSIEEKIDVIFIGAGLPLKIPAGMTFEELQKTNTKIIPKVSSAKAARLIFQYWANKYNQVPDAVAVEGPKAGGHLGFKKEQLTDEKYSISKITSETVAVIKQFEKQFDKKIPVIAGGGIYTGKDIYNIFKQGATAVKMGTRFVTTHECDAAIEFKESYLASKQSDITIIDSPVGLPGQVIKNSFVEKVQNGLEKPVKCPWKCLKSCNFKEVPYCIAEALFNSAQGKMDEGFAFAGSKAYMAEKIQSVKDTFNEIIDEYENCILVPKLETVKY